MNALFSFHTKKQNNVVNPTSKFNTGVFMPLASSEVLKRQQHTVQCFITNLSFTKQFKIKQLQKVFSSFMCYTPLKTASKKQAALLNLT